MAGDYDGSVKINAEIDLTGLKSDSLEAENIAKKTAKKMASAFDDFADDAGDSFDDLVYTFEGGGDEIQSDLTANLQFLENKFNSLAAEATSDIKKIEQTTESTGGAMQKIFSVTTVAIGNMLADLARSAVQSFKQMVGASFDLAMEFDDSMLQVQATLGLTGEEGEAAFNALSAAAREAGATTRFTASDGADALNYLALAGYDAADAIEMLPYLMDLAAAGNISIADTANMLTNSIAALGLAENQTTEYIDKLAKTSQKSNTTVAQLGEAMLTVGALAPSANQDISDMATALGLLANVNLKGSEGGTMMRNMILSLQSPTAAAEKALKQLGVSAFDSEGQMRSMIDIMSDMNEATKGMTDAEKSSYLNDIFNRRDVVAALGLMSEIEAGGKELYDTIENDSAGAGKQMADTLEGGIGGVIRELDSLKEELMLTFGDALAAPIMLIFPLIQKVMNGINEGMQKLFGAFTDEHAAAFTLYISDLVDILLIFIGHIFDAATIVLPLLMDGFVLLMRIMHPIYNLFKQWYQTLSKGILVVLRIIAPILKTYIQMFHEIFDYLEPILKTVWEGLNKILEPLQTLYDTAKKALSLLGIEFEDVGEEIDVEKEKAEEFDEALTALDGKQVNTYVNTEYTTSGAGSGSIAGKGSGSSSSYSGTVYAGVSNMGFDSEKNAYVNSKTGTVISADKISSREDLVQASKFHSGGIVPGFGELPAILQGREMVLTQGQQANLYNMANGSKVPYQNNSNAGGMNASDLNNFAVIIANALQSVMENTSFDVNVQNTVRLDPDKLAETMFEPTKRVNNRRGV